MLNYYLTCTLSVTTYSVLFWMSEANCTGNSFVVKNVGLSTYYLGGLAIIIIIENINDVVLYYFASILKIILQVSHENVM